MRWFAFFIALGLAACTPSQQSQTKSQADDAFILAQIRAKITAIDAATVSTVNVEVQNGRVSLSGEVPNAKERAQIADASRSVSGVTAVADRIAVNPRTKTAEQITNDIALAAKVKAALAVQTGVNAFHISVKTDRGIVSLSGSVPSSALHTTAIATVKSVSGVRRVVDRLRIQR